MLGGEKTGSVHKFGRFRENLDVELAGRSCGVWDLDISTMTRRYRVLLRQGTVE